MFSKYYPIVIVAILVAWNYYNYRCSANIALMGAIVLLIYYISNTSLINNSSRKSLNIYSEYKYLRNSEICKSIIYNLRDIEKYDKGDYNKLITLTDKFLRLYYNIIGDKYDRSYIGELADTRREILNIMYNFIVDAPMFSRRGARLDAVIHNEILNMQAYTYKKMRNINKKYPEYNPDHPRGISPDIADSYNIIV
jgi:hypothetical protein